MGLWSSHDSSGLKKLLNLRTCYEHWMTQWSSSTRKIAYSLICQLMHIVLLQKGVRRIRGDWRNKK
jgi:hypothetical protein